MEPRAVTRTLAPPQREPRPPILEPKRPDLLKDPLEEVDQDTLQDPLGREAVHGAPLDPPPPDPDDAPLDQLLTRPPPGRDLDERERAVDQAAVAVERLLQRSSDPKEVERELPQLQESYDLDELRFDRSKKGEPEVLVLRDTVNERRVPVRSPQSKQDKQNKGTKKPPAPPKEKPPGPGGVDGANGPNPKGEDPEVKPDELDTQVDNTKPKTEALADDKKKAPEGDPKVGEQVVDQQIKGEVPPPPPVKQNATPPTTAPPAPVPPPVVAPGTLPPPDLAKLGIDTTGMPPEGIAELQAVLAQMQAQNQAQLAAFVGARSGEAAALAGLRATIAGQIQGAAAAAKAQVQAEAAARKAAVEKSVAAARAKAAQSAAQVKGTIAQQHQAALGQIGASTRAARSTLTANRIATLAQIGALEQGQLGLIKSIYAQGATQYIAAGQQVGKEAVAEAERRAKGFLSKKIHRADSFLDGHLTDNRCDARADAARSVGKEYQKGLAEEAKKHALGLAKLALNDVAGAQSAAKLARTELDRVFKDLSELLTGTDKASRDNADATLAAMNKGVDRSLALANKSLDQHRKASLDNIGQGATDACAAIDAQAAQAIAALSQALEDALKALGEALDKLCAAIDNGSLPDPEELGGVLTDAGAQFTAAVGQLREALLGGVQKVIEGLNTNRDKAVGVLGQRGQAAVDASGQMSTQVREQLGAMGKASGKAYGDLGKGHDKLMTQAMQAGAKAFAGATQGLSKGYADVARQTREGLKANTKGLTEGLRGTFKDMHKTIDAEAKKAADKVQPAWKSVLKWVLIIVVVLVVALVLGPFIIGAVTGAAAALGASAAAAGVIGTIVGGAIVGAISGAATTILTNLVDGKKWHEGVGQAALLGALGGAIGGAAGALSSSLPALAQFAISVAVDVAFDTVTKVVTGEFTWEGFFQTLVSSILTNGAGNIPAIKNIQERFKNSGVRFGNRAFGGSGSVPGINAPKVDEPTTKVDEPTTKVDEASTKVEEPTTKVEEPPTKVEEPTTKAEPEATPKVEEPPPKVEPTPVKEEPKLLPPPKEEPKLLPPPKEEVEVKATNTDESVEATGPKVDEGHIKIELEVKAEVDSLVKVAQSQGDTAGELKLNQILRESGGGISDTLKLEFMKDLQVTMAKPENAGKTMFEMVQQTVGANKAKYCNQGEPVPLSALKEKGAFARVITFEDAWKFYMSDGQRQYWIDTHGVNDANGFAALVGKNTSLFDPKVHLDQTKVISGRNDVGWWGVKADTKATNINELVDALALDPKYYKNGGFRVSVEPETVFKAGIKKPTAFDGMFKEWVEAQPGSTFGMTGGGKAEGVVKAVSIGQVDGFEIFSGM